MPALTSTDPFTMLEQALWWALDSHPALSRLVNVANVVRFCSDNPVPAKDNLATADLPELALMPMSMGANQRNSSSGTGINQRYNVIITTGDLRTAGGIGRRKGLNQVKWAVVRALARYCKAGIPDLPFRVSKVTVSDSTERIDAGGQQADQARAPDGWTSVLVVECWLDFSWDEVLA